MNLLIVCTGNTCRSPMAQGIVASIIKKHKQEDNFTVVSCGVSAFDGQSASENAIAALKEMGIDISEHGSQRVNLELLDLADKIYVMTDTHKQVLVSAFPEIADKIKVVNVSDPFGGDLVAYSACRDQLVAYFEDEIKLILDATDENK